MSRIRLTLPLVVVLLGLLVLTEPRVNSQITLPFPSFVAGTVIDPNQVNSNFSTLGNQALNRTGGTLTGTLTTQHVYPSADNTWDLGQNVSTRYRDLWLGRNATIGGTLGVTGATTLTGALAANGTNTLNGATTSANSFTQSGSLVANTTSFTVYQNLGVSNTNTFDVGVSGSQWRDGWFGRDIHYGRTALGPAVFNAGNSSTAITVNFATNAVQTVLRTASTTITLSAPPADGFYTLVLQHENSANVYTVAYSPAIRFPGGVAPTYCQTAFCYDVVSLFYNSLFGLWSATFQGNFL